MIAAAHGASLAGGFVFLAIFAAVFLVLPVVVIRPWRG